MNTELGVFRFDVAGISAFSAQSWSVIDSRIEAIGDATGAPPIDRTDSALARHRPSFSDLSRFGIALSGPVFQAAG